MSSFVQEEFAFCPSGPPRWQGFMGEWKVVSVRAPPRLSAEPVTDPQTAFRYWRRHIQGSPLFNPEVECGAVLALDCRLRPRGHHIVSLGTVNEAMLNPREVFRAAIVASAYAIILMHNHPTGDPEPSQADRRATTRMREAGEVLQIKLFDHVIIGNPTSYSFRESGLL